MLTPRKGTAPAAPKTKPSRRDALMAATAALAAEQLPTEDTMSAIEGTAEGSGDSTGDGAGAAQAPSPAPAPTPLAAEAPRPPAAPAVASAHGPAKAAEVPVAAESRREREPQQAAPTSDTALHVEEVRISDVRPSPFQPKGRPSTAAVSAVRLAIVEAGSLEQLTGKEGTRLFSRLDPEAARLAELAYDILEHGVKTPVEVRVAEDGWLECLSGHRRLAAAMLAGVERVPAINNGPMSSAAAAATVLRGNLHRENFTTWQEAVLVAEVAERRKADGYQDNVRTLGQVMGWSHGKTNMLLRIRRALAPELLARVSGDGDPSAGSGQAVAAVEERLSRTAYRDLERLANEPDASARLGAVRRMLGLDGVAPVSPREHSAYLHRPKRGGGFIIEVNDAVESLSAMDALALKDVLEAQLGRVDARLRALGVAR